MLVSYSIAAMGLNLFFVLAGNIHFDINVLLFSSLLWGLEAAETAVVLFLFIVTANCLAIINIKHELFNLRALFGTPMISYIGSVYIDLIII